MPSVYAAILELFGSLRSDERKQLAEHLYISSLDAVFLDSMSAAQCRHEHEAILCADRQELGALTSPARFRFGRELPTIAA